MTVDADTLNRLGMVIGFVSFWLVAPEILGEEVLLKHAEVAVDIFRLVLVLVIALYVGLGFYYFYSAFRVLFQSDTPQPFRVATVFLNTLITLSFTRIALHSVLMHSRDPYLRRVSISSEILSGISDATLSLFVNVLILNAAAFAIAFALGDADVRNVPLRAQFAALVQATTQLLVSTVIATGFVIVSPRILAKLYDASGRLYLFYLGATLFTLGFLLQLVATYLPD